MIHESCTGCPYDNFGCLKCKLGYLRVHEDAGMSRPFLCKMQDDVIQKEAHA